MYLYEVTSEPGDMVPVHVIARGYDDAADASTTWAAANDRLPHVFAIELQLISWFAHPQRDQMPDVFTLGLSGIATFNEVTGWHVEPLPID